MTYSEQEIERIVVEVIRRLGLLDQEQRHSKTKANEVDPEHHALSIGDRVVTLRSIEGRLAGVSRVVVPARAVVTPAVRDELKQRQIKLIREAAK